MRTRHWWVGPFAIVLILVGSECVAQTTGSFSDVPDHFRLELGGFHFVSCNPSFSARM